MGNYEGLKNFSEALKNILLLLFYGVITYFVLFYGFPFLKDQFKDHKVELKKINAGPFEIEVTKISDAVNSTRVQNINSGDIKVDIASIPAASYLDTSLQVIAKRYCVYIGQYNNKKLWLTKNFSIDTPITKITALNDVYKREGLPTKLSKDDWKLGRIIGLINKDETLRVIKDTIIEDNNVWAIIQGQQ